MTSQFCTCLMNVCRWAELLHTETTLLFVPVRTGLSTEHSKMVGEGQQSVDSSDDPGYASCLPHSFRFKVTPSISGMFTPS